MSLHATINDLAVKFARDLVTALRGASLNEIIADSNTSTKVKRTNTVAFVATSRQSKRIRRSPEELQAAADRIVATVAKHPNGIKAEELKRALGVKPGNVGAKVFTIPLSVALKSKKIRKSGARRATTYFKA